MVETELRAIGARLGRMPSSRDLVALGKNDLSCAVPRFGGFRFWAIRLCLPVADSTASRGRAYEDHVAEFLQERGHRVERQTARHPFDLLVDGSTRIDVKGGRWHSYPASTGPISGYFFQLHRNDPLCDLFVLCCGEPGDVVAHYVVPAEAALVQTITIAPGGTRYTRFREAWDAIPLPTTKTQAA